MADFEMKINCYFDGNILNNVNLVLFKISNYLKRNYGKQSGLGEFTCSIIT